MKEKKPIVAIMYDFDKTLSTKDMQEYTFIPKLDMEPHDFWEKCNELAKKEKMDRILASMYMMIEQSNANFSSIRREDFVEHGKHIEFFPGVKAWFKMINNFGDEMGVQVDHYIISSGMKEIIEGTEIAEEFKEIYASEYLYENNVAVWPKMSINYTNKTQYLFRINKGIFDISNDEELNEVINEDDRYTPFRNMIYIGDGFTDVPCMKLVKDRGGKSIAVYTKGKKKHVDSLLVGDRVNFLLEADYRENAQLHQVIKCIIIKMAADDKLVEIHKDQLNDVGLEE